MPTIHLAHALSDEQRRLELAAATSDRTDS